MAATLDRARAGGAAPGRARDKRGCTPRERSPAVRRRGRAAPGARCRATARRPGGLERRGLAAAGVHRAGPSRPGPVARPLPAEATRVNAVDGPQVEAAMLTASVPPGSRIGMALRHRAGTRVGRDDVRGRATPGRPAASMSSASRLADGASAAGAVATRRSRPARPARSPRLMECRTVVPSDCRVRGRTDSDTERYVDARP